MAASDFFKDEESLFRLSRQVEEQWNQIRKLAEPFSKGLAKELSLYQEQQDLIRELAKSVPQPLAREFFPHPVPQIRDVLGLSDKTIQRLREEEDRWRERMQRIQETALQQSKWLTEDRAFMQEAIEASISFRNQIPEIDSYWHELLAKPTILPELLTATAKQLQKFSPPYERPEIQPDGALVFDDGSTSFTELETTIENIFSDVDQPGFIKNFSSKIQALSQSKLSVLQAILLYALFQHINPLFNSLILEPLIKDIHHYFYRKPYESSKDIKQAIKNCPYDLSMLDILDHRVVSISQGLLNLREEPDVESSVIARLGRGKCVRVIETYGKWSFVEVHPEENEERKTGWVYSRFLAKLH